MDWTIAVAQDRPLDRTAAFTEGDMKWPQTVAQFEALVEAVQDELVHFAFCRLRNQPDAEDVVQDVLVQAYLERARHCAIVRVRPYLYRMVANRCTDLLRKRQRAARPIHPPPAPDPPEHRLAEVEALLTKLPERQAEAIRLRIFGGLPFQTIAEAAGVSLPTIKSRFRYGVERLRSLLSREAER
ncbi:RNA polymerase, sigma-24 subunit, ECF subfamily [Candidatus Sulfopaludibacter sp. SbA3]|nr:RNA polymerase, sigma-24 subunit, ECF subfamily [Candidatus Sulfopaludibacter sp. SbA3]